MKKIAKKLTSILLCFLIVFSSVSAVAAADGGAYPEGVTAEEALAAVSGTDKLLSAAVPMLTGDSLSELAMPMICNSNTLSSMLISTYISMEEQGGGLDTIGIDVSVKGVAEALSDYPAVKSALLKYDSWSEVKLDGVNWGVTDKKGFAKAMGAIMSPLNDFLFTLLCSGTFEISRFIKITGADGYTTAIIPMFKALKCTEYMSQEEFNSKATADKNSMIENITLTILNWLEKGLGSPMGTFTVSLPSFAYFVESGEMEKCMDALMEPVTSNALVELAGMLNLFDASVMDMDFSSMLTNMSSGEDFKMAELDMAKLAECGSVQGGSFVSDKGRAYVVIMRWLVDTLKLNSDSLNGFGNTESLVSADLIKQLTEKDTDDVVATIILLFSPAQPGEAQAMIYPAFSPSSVQYTPNLTAENYEKVLNEIDGVLSEFVKEDGTYETVEELLRATIYTNANISSLVIGVYGALEENGLIDMLKLLGTDASPAGVAASLKEGRYNKAVSALKKADSWKKLSSDSLNWGFYDGSRRGFRDALVAVLRPVYPLLRVMLAEEDMVVMDSITLKGADGYNSSVIPLLEALGCDGKSIKTYADYKKTSDTDKVMEDIVEPVLDLLDDICEKPVYTLTEKLPNIIYFMNSGSLEKCISNLLLPVTAFSSKLSGIYDMEFDTAELTKQLDINQLIKGMTEGGGLKIAEFDINTVASFGTAKEKESKAVLNGKNVTYTYIEADQTAVLMSLLRVLAKTLKLPGNEELLTSAMGSNENFASYSTSISDQFANMSENEIIEWLYNLLFKERVTVDIVEEEDYKPTIIYQEEQPNYIWLGILIGYLAIAAVVGVIIALNKKRLYN